MTGRQTEMADSTSPKLQLRACPVQGREGRGRQGDFARERGGPRTPPQGADTPPLILQKQEVHAAGSRDSRQGPGGRSGFQEAVDKRSRGRTRGWETHTPAIAASLPRPSQQVRPESFPPCSTRYCFLSLMNSTSFVTPSSARPTLCLQSFAAFGQQFKLQLTVHTEWRGKSRHVTTCTLQASEHASEEKEVSKVTNMFNILNADA